MSLFKLSAISEPITSEVGLEHAVLQSLLNWSKAQANDPIDEDQNKQGWWGSEFVKAVGCRDWTLARSKRTGDTLSRAKRYTEKALQWLIDESIVKTITVTAAYEGEKLKRTIDITLKNNEQQQVIL